MSDRGALAEDEVRVLLMVRLLTNYNFGIYSHFSIPAMLESEHSSQKSIKFCCKFGVLQKILGDRLKYKQKLTFFNN